MAKQHPNLTWTNFAVCNDNGTKAFEDMCRRLFRLYFLKDTAVPHSNHNNPGVEVLPEFEPAHTDPSTQKRISFQAKYFAEGYVDYGKIQASFKKAVKYYKGDLDRVYLFCNKTLTTTRKGYKDAEKILNDANIELKPISNDELLDLIDEYEQLREYFFMPRKNPLDFGSSPIIFEQITAQVTSAIEEAQNKGSQDAKLLSGLLSDKIEECRKAIFNLKLSDLKIQLSKLSESDNQEILFFRFLYNLHEGIKVSSVEGSYRDEAAWVKDIYDNPRIISVNEFCVHCLEAQVFVLDKLFDKQFWDCVIELCENVRIEAIQDQLDLHYGLSLFNKQELDKAHSVLSSLENKTGQYGFFSLLVDIRIANRTFENGSDADKDHLGELLIKLESFKDDKQYQSNISIVTLLQLLSLYHLGLNDKKFLEEAIELYCKTAT